MLTDATHRRYFTAFICFACAVCLRPNPVHALYSSNDALLPSPNYRSTTGLVFSTPGGPVGVVRFFDYFPESDRSPAPAFGTSRTDAFFDVVTELTYFGPGSGPDVTVTLHGDAQIRTVADISVAFPFYGYHTEMLSMNMSDGGSPGIMIRESPTLASIGSVGIIDVGGLYQYGSDFDLCTELSLDGGNTWTPGNSVHIQGVPEPAAGMFCGLSAFVLATRRRGLRPT